jgi:hypothetical protein
VYVPGDSWSVAPIESSVMLTYRLPAEGWLPVTVALRFPDATASVPFFSTTVTLAPVNPESSAVPSVRVTRSTLLALETGVARNVIGVACPEAKVTLWR